MTLIERNADIDADVIVTSRPLVLASASPRRADLLRQVGLGFEVAVSDVDETLINGSTPAETALSLAVAKARSVAAKVPGKAVLAADTVVSLDGVELGKPSDERDAISTLLRLSGRAHTVYTGVAVIVNGAEFSAVAESVTLFRELSTEEIERYVATGSPMDKAGSYGIQDTDFSPVKSFDGSYNNVVGLPLAVTASLLARSGVIDESAAEQIAARDA